MPQKSRFAVLAGLVLLALMLRVAGGGFGLPHHFHPDEPTHVEQALAPGRGLIGVPAPRTAHREARR